MKNLHFMTGPHKRMWSEPLTSKEIELCREIVTEHRLIESLQRQVAEYREMVATVSNILKEASGDTRPIEDNEDFIDLCLEISGVVTAVKVSYNAKEKEYEISP